VSSGKRYFTVARFSRAALPAGWAAAQHPSRPSILVAGGPIGRSGSLITNSLVSAMCIYIIAVLLTLMVEGLLPSWGHKK